MKRRRHTIFNTPNAIVLLLCVAAATLWVRSYSHPLRIRFNWHGEAREVQWARGRVFLDNWPQVNLAKSAEGAYRERLVRRRALLARSIEVSMQASMQSKVDRKRAAQRLEAYANSTDLAALMDRLAPARSAMSGGAIDSWSGADLAPKPSRRFIGDGEDRRFQIVSPGGFQMPINGRRRGPIAQPIRFSASLHAAWFPLVAGMLLMPQARASWRQRRARARGLCLSCSYDLTGNVSGVCPECGTSVTKGG